MTEPATIFEMGPRDGVRIEPAPIRTAQRFQRVDRLSVRVFTRIDVTNHVSPNWVPQVAHSTADAGTSA